MSSAAGSKRPLTELGAFDLILCRNVLIYFDEPTRAQVCRGLYRALRPGGWLALGSAESLQDAGAELESVKKRRCCLAAAWVLLSVHAHIDD